jgi:hypothetical protein
VSRDALLGFFVLPALAFSVGYFQVLNRLIVGLVSPYARAEVHQAIEACHAFVLLASNKSINAHQVIREVEQAHEREKVIIPIRVGLTHQQYVAANPILRMASGTAVTLSATEDNLADVAQRIARTIQVSLNEERTPPQTDERAETSSDDVSQATPEASAPDYRRYGHAAGAGIFGETALRQLKRPATLVSLVAIIGVVLAAQLDVTRKALIDPLLNAFRATPSESADTSSSNSTAAPSIVTTPPRTRRLLPVGRSLLPLAVSTPRRFQFRRTSMLV